MINILTILAILTILTLKFTPTAVVQRPGSSPTHKLKWFESTWNWGGGPSILCIFYVVRGSLVRRMIGRKWGGKWRTHIQNVSFFPWQTPSPSAKLAGTQEKGHSVSQSVSEIPKFHQVQKYGWWGGWWWELSSELFCWMVRGSLVSSSIVPLSSLVRRSDVRE